MKGSKVLGLVLALVMALSCNPMQSFAAEEIKLAEIVPQKVEAVKTIQEAEIALAKGEISPMAYVGIVSASTWISFHSKGVDISYYTEASQVCEEVGIRDLKLQKKSGLFWTTVATGGVHSNEDVRVYASMATVTNVESGYTYRATCVHFAYIGGRDYAKDGTSSEVKCP